METYSTEVKAEAGKQDLKVNRIFEISVDQLFEAFSNPEIIEQWMENKVTHHEGWPFGKWAFEKTDTHGNILFAAHGVYHEFIQGQKITRTFEITSGPLGPHIEYLEFESLGDEKSKLTMHIVYRSELIRDQMVEYGMAKGMHLAHNRIEKILKKSRS